MPSFKAIELFVESGEPTGKVEHYTARNKKEAARKVLYTRRLKQGRCRIGATGLVISCSNDKAWVLMKESKRRKR